MSVCVCECVCVLFLGGDIIFFLKDNKMWGCFYTFFVHYNYYIVGSFKVLWTFGTKMSHTHMHMTLLPLLRLRSIKRRVPSVSFSGPVTFYREPKGSKFN